MKSGCRAPCRWQAEEQSARLLPGCQGAPCLPVPCSAAPTAPPGGCSKEWQRGAAPGTAARPYSMLQPPPPPACPLAPCSLHRNPRSAAGTCQNPQPGSGKRSAPLQVKQVTGCPQRPGYAQPGAGTSRGSLASQGAMLSPPAAPTPPRHSLRVYLMPSHCLPGISHSGCSSWPCTVPASSSQPWGPSPRSPPNPTASPQAAQPPIPPQPRAEPDPSPQAHEERHPSLGQNPFITQTRCSVRPVPAPQQGTGPKSCTPRPRAGGRATGGGGWQEGKGGTWQKQGHRHGARRGVRVQGGTRRDAIHTTGHAAIRTKIKAIY